MTLSTYYSHLSSHRKKIIKRSTNLLSQTQESGTHCVLPSPRQLHSSPAHLQQMKGFYSLSFISSRTFVIMISFIILRPPAHLKQMKILSFYSLSFILSRTFAIMISFIILRPLTHLRHTNFIKKK